MAFCPQLIAKIKTDPIMAMATDSFPELCQKYADNLEKSLKTKPRLSIAERVGLSCDKAQKRQSAWADKLHDKGAARRVAAIPGAKRDEKPQRNLKIKPKNPPNSALADAFAAAKRKMTDAK